jgi:biotin carboxyl carrier protein
MKMETVIRSPQHGVVAKLVHKAGVSDLGCEEVVHC